MTNSFTEKAIRVTFTKASGLASSGNCSNTLVLEGLRCSALVAMDGAKTSLDLGVYGMKNEQMADLSTFGKTFPLVSKDVSVMVEAGDSSGMAVVFIGALIWAWQDFSEMPLAKFHVTAIDVMNYKLRPVPPSSYQGTSPLS